MAEQKTYCGKAKPGRFANSYRISLAPEDIEAIVRSANTKGWVNLAMSEMRNMDRNGNTHTLYIDTWQPGQGGGAMNQHREQGQGNYDSSDIPRQRGGAQNNGGFPELPPAGIEADDDDIPF